jgi:CRISPR-associated endoribonuclease Cas6
MKIIEIKLEAVLKRDILYLDSHSAIGNYIVSCLRLGELLQPKFYTFGSFRPLEKDKIYKANTPYSFKIRTMNKEFAEIFQQTYRYISTYDILFTSIYDVVEITPFQIKELYTLTPTMALKEDGQFWTPRDKDTELLKALLHNNVEKKYRMVLSQWDKRIDKNFIKEIEVKNTVPHCITFHNSGRTLKMFGNKLSITPNRDETSQALAFVAYGCGLGEKCPHGGGFTLARE